SLDGSHVEEAHAAVDLLERETGSETLVVLGHCSGGRSALLCADQDTRVNGVGTWAAQVTDSGQAVGGGAARKAGQRIHAKTTPALGVYGSRDVAWSPFRAMATRLAGASSLEPPWTICTIPSANHDFTSIGWTGEAINATLHWLTTRHVSWSPMSGVRWIS